MDEHTPLSKCSGQSNGVQTEAVVAFVHTLSIE
jgi:hypothetical protein